MEESFSVDQASAHAMEWCNKHPSWQRICDIENTDVLYKSFDELSGKQRKYWQENYPCDQEGSWL